MSDAGTSGVESPTLSEVIGRLTEAMFREAIRMAVLKAARQHNHAMAKGFEEDGSL